MDFTFPSFPVLFLWLSTLVVAVLVAVFWRKWPRLGLLGLACVILAIGFLPIGYQEWQQRAEQRDYAAILTSFQEYQKVQGIDDAVPGQPGKGKWWAIPYTSVKSGSGVLLTTGKDAKGAQVWLRVQQ